MTRITTKTDNYRLVYIISVIAVGIVFFYILGAGSYQMFADSTTFIDWSYSSAIKGYLIYPWFLKICRTVFGEAHYLMAAYMIQSALAMISSIFAAECMRRTYSMGYISALTIYILIILTYGFTLPEAVSTHYIFTESLSIPFFVVMFCCMLMYIAGGNKYMLLIALLLNVLLTIIRPQLFAIMAMSVFILLLHLIFRRVKGRATEFLVYGAIPLTILAVALTLIASVFLSAVIYDDTSADSQFHEALFGKVMCILEREDAALYDDKVAEVYTALYENTDRSGDLDDHFPDSILEYETVQWIIDDNIRDTKSFIRETIDRVYGEDPSLRYVTFRNTTASKEIRAHKAAYIGITLRLIPSSLVSSIFIQPRAIRLLCNIVAMIIYLSSVILMYAAYRRRVRPVYTAPMLMTYAYITGNAVASNIVLYGQQRYVIYCFGIFYVSLFILIRGICEKVGPTALSPGSDRSE